LLSLEASRSASETRKLGLSVPEGLRFGRLVVKDRTGADLAPCSGAAMRTSSLQAPLLSCDSNFISEISARHCAQGIQHESTCHLTQVRQVTTTMARGGSLTWWEIPELLDYCDWSNSCRRKLNRDFLSSNQEAFRLQQRAVRSEMSALRSGQSAASSKKSAASTK
jgi:hypothetical protein